MLVETDPAVIADFVTRKIAQGEKVMSSLSGTSVVSSGERGSQIMLRHEGANGIIVITYTTSP